MPPVPTPISTTAAAPSSSTGVGGPPSSPSSKLGGGDGARLRGLDVLLRELVGGRLDRLGVGRVGGGGLRVAAALGRARRRRTGVVVAACGRLVGLLAGDARPGRAARPGVQLRAPCGLGGADDAGRLAVLLEVGIDHRKRLVVAAQRVLARDGALLGRLGQDLVAAIRRRERRQDEQRSAHEGGAQEAVSSPHGGESSGPAPRRDPVPRRTRPPRSPGTGRAPRRPGWPGSPSPTALERRSGRSGSPGCGCPRRW